MFKKGAYLYAFNILVLSIALSACSSSRKVLVKDLSSKDNCNQQNLYTYSAKDFPQPFYKLNLDTALTSRFSQASLNIGNAIGIIDLLEDYVKAELKYKVSPTIDNKVHILDVDRKITNAVQRASLEISAVASEIDCEEERADQIAYFLKKKEDDRETKLTVAAISVGAIATIASGIIFVKHENEVAEHSVEIVGGVAEAILGFMIFTSKPRIEFYHTRNHLGEIWNGKDTSTLFPSHIWYYFNYYNPEKPDNYSLRVQILKGWMTIDQWEKIDSKKKRHLIELVFGKGGVYTSEHLKARARMLDQLQAYITLMKQDLTMLSNDLEKISER